AGEATAGTSSRGTDPSAAALDLETMDIPLLIDTEVKRPQQPQQKPQQQREPAAATATATSATARGPSQTSAAPGTGQIPGTGEGKTTPGLVLENQQEAASSRSAGGRPAGPAKSSATDGQRPRMTDLSAYQA
ncbi:unnamed protein product, partial [Ectocarpus sp. 12 AP-2014]